MNKEVYEAVEEIDKWIESSGVRMVVGESGPDELYGVNDKFVAFKTKEGYGCAVIMDGRGIGRVEVYGKDGEEINRWKRE